MNTIAEQIAAELGNDGARWETDDGRNVEEIFAERCIDYTSELPTRYTFEDGSYIVAGNSGWWTDEDDRSQATVY